MLAGGRAPLPGQRGGGQAGQGPAFPGQVRLVGVAGLGRQSGQVVGVLPVPMLAALTSAWQNSIKADRDFAQWARDEISGGCTSGNQSADPHARAAAGPDALATTGKQAFVGQWNPVATRYGLPTYRWNQL